MGLFFLSFGSQKFTDRYWIGVFATIGSAAIPAIILAMLVAIGSNART